MPRRGKRIPDGYIAREPHKQELIESDKYEHWTVADLIELLGEYDPDARVWVEPEDGVIWPVEMIAGSDGEVYLR
jgi:hypothetical protein